jgi:uncharacterized membrane protein SpoIIM required for sporulation
MSAGKSPGHRLRKTRSESLHLTRRSLIAGMCYEGAVVAVATGGAVTHDPKYWIVMLGLTLFSGLAAFVGLYIGYGLLVTLGAAFGAHMSANGYGPLWFVIPDGIIDVVLFAIAGAVNVALAGRLAAGLRACRSRRRLEVSGVGHSEPGGDVAGKLGLG